MTHGRPVAVAGVHVTEQARRLDGRTSFDLALESVLGCLTDAGLDRADVDGVLLDWPGPGGIAGETSSWARLLGRRASLSSDTIMDNAGARGLLKATAMVAAGFCDVVVVGGGMAGVFGGGPVPGGSGATYSDLWGCYVVPHFALVAQRHMADHGTTAEQIARVAAVIRNNGHVNEEAVMHGRGPYTVDDVLASPMVASPLHRLEVCLTAEGGAAYVVTTLDRARDLRQKAVVVRGGGMEYHQGAYANPALLREVGDLGALAMRRALGLADLDRGDIDVLSVYDPSSFEVIRQLEALGFCEAGDGGGLVDAGVIELDGALPVNPDGGCLAHSWNGTQQMSIRVIEAVRQLRGTAVNQVVSARHALVANAGSGAQHYELAILGADR
ncbi:MULTISPECIES: thiolase family protein [Frankia]|uniref:thiolase family protein n=1 Tax=Frankia TaxID=1854 RepID=UPI0002DB54B8|nr:MULTISPECIES: thiolase family protein [Frankia]